MEDKDKPKADVIDLAAHKAALEKAQADGTTAAEAAFKLRVSAIRDAFAGPLATRPQLGTLMAECIADGLTVEAAQTKLITALAEAGGPEVSNRHAGGGGHPADQPTRLTAKDTTRFYANRRQAVAEAKAARQGAR